ncbi:MAG: DUF2760 domain-containing protein [Polyangia bacterium]
MSRFLLALRCFFAVLLRFRLPPDAVALLPPPDPEALGGAPPRSLPEPGPSAVAPEPPRPAPARIEVKPVESAPVPPPVAAPAPAPAQAAEVSDEQRQALRHRGAVQILSVLQREGRLLDFLFEDIDSYADAQIGAAVRDIHRSCKKALREHMSIAPIRPEPDEAVVRVPAGHDASQIRLVGNVTGRPPFEGTLRHHGWRTTRIQLSDTPAGHDPSVIAPAEVEIGA